MAFQDFTTPGVDTFTVPPVVNKITVEVIGAGADGDPSSTGSGGGGGAYIRKVDIFVTPGQVFNLEIGARGSSGGNTDWNDGEFVAGG